MNIPRRLVSIELIRGLNRGKFQMIISSVKESPPVREAIDQDQINLIRSKLWKKSWLSRTRNEEPCKYCQMLLGIGSRTSWTCSNSIQHGYGPLFLEVGGHPDDLHGHAIHLLQQNQHWFKKTTKSSTTVSILTFST